MDKLLRSKWPVRIVVVGVVLYFLGTFLTAFSHAHAADATTTTTYSTAVLRECPGTVWERRARNARNCEESDPARAEGPYFVNFEKTTAAGEHLYCRLVRIGQPTVRCGATWPFIVAK